MSLNHDTSHHSTVEFLNLIGCLKSGLKGLLVPHVPPIISYQARVPPPPPVIRRLNVK